MKRKILLCFSASIITIAALSPITLSNSLHEEKLLYENDNYILNIINQVNESLVFYYLDSLIEFGPRYTGSENCSNAAQYIFNEFHKMGLDVRFHNWSYAGFKSQNVIATLNGTDSSSDAIVIMSAHYDCALGSLGADDDASGIAAILASAQLMSQFDFNHTIRFIAFSGEEVGTYGSFMYAKDAYNKGDNILAVINIDMIGYADTAKGGKLLRVFETERTKWISSFSIDVSRRYWEHIELSVQPIPNYRGADHQAFLDYGYNAVFYAHYDGYPWANSPDDTPDYLNHTYEVKATKLLLAIVAELANKPMYLQVILKSPFEGCIYVSNNPLFPLPLGRLWFNGLRGTTVLLGSSVAQVEVKNRYDIEYVIFCIDNNFISWDRNPPYEWKIEGKHAPPLGKHTIRVYAYDIKGNIASDEMDIIIFTALYQYAPWNNQ